MRLKPLHLSYLFLFITFNVPIESTKKKKPKYSSRCPNNVSVVYYSFGTKNSFPNGHKNTFDLVRHYANAKTTTGTQNKYLSQAFCLFHSSACVITVTQSATYQSLNEILFAVVIGCRWRLNEIKRLFCRLTVPLTLFLSLTHTQSAQATFYSELNARRSKKEKEHLIAVNQSQRNAIKKFETDAIETMFTFQRRLSKFHR